MNHWAKIICFQTSRWSTWISGCPQNITYAGLCVSILASLQLHFVLTFLRRYPNTIPTLTAIPGWAYSNVTAKNTFNVNEALADNSPDSTIGSNPSSTASASATQRSTITSSAQSSAITSPAPKLTSATSGISSEHKSIIAGGVVGAVAAISLLAALNYKYPHLLLSSRLGLNIRPQLRPRKEPTDSELGKVPLMSSNHSNNTIEINSAFTPPIYVSAYNMMYTCTKHSCPKSTI